MFTHNVRSRLNLSVNIPLHFAAVWQMAAERQSHRMVSEMEVCIKQRCKTEFPHEENVAPTNIHWHLMNIYRDQTVDVSTVKLWVVHFSNADNSVKGKPWNKWPWRFLPSQNEDSCSSVKINALLMIRTTLKNSVL